MFNIIKTRKQIEAEAKELAAAEAAAIEAAETADRIEAEEAARAALPEISTRLVNVYLQEFGVDQKFSMNNNVPTIEDYEIGVEFAMSDEQHDTLIENIRTWMESRIAKASKRALKDYATAAGKK